MTNWQFVNPLLLLLLVPALAALAFAWRRRSPGIRVSTLTPYRESGGARSGFAARIPLLLEFLALALLVVALARPRQGIEEFTQRSRGVDIILCLDVSGSMRSYDVPESMSPNEASEAIRDERLQNRFHVAKRELRNFVESRSEDRIGLIAFAKVPYVVSPPTLDHDFLLEHLEMLEAGMFGDSATGIAGPIASATQRLKDSDAEERVAVLFTDGANNVESKISPRQAARIAETFDVRIHTVGVGSNRAFIIARSPWGGQTLRPARSDLDIELLKAIAEASRGQFFEARDAEGFRAVMREIDEMETIDFEAPRYVNYKEWFPHLLAAAAALLIAAVLLNNTLLCRAP
ncbi:MAG: VWA domain-containing protein [Verrucomicrobiota bacterium]